MKYLNLQAEKSLGGYSETKVNSMFDEDLCSKLLNIVKENPGLIQREIRKIYNQGPWLPINQKKPINKHLYELAMRGRIKKGDPKEGKLAPTWWPNDGGVDDDDDNDNDNDNDKQQYSFTKI